jgi:hypothetical protein
LNAMVSRMFPATLSRSAPSTLPPSIPTLDDGSINNGSRSKTRKQITKGKRRGTNKQYMWATRMSHSPNMPSTETHFYQQAIVHLDASAATGDRLMDCIRAAFLLSAFQYMNGRHHSVSPPLIFDLPPSFSVIFSGLIYRDTSCVVIQLSEFHPNWIIMILMIDW